MSFTSCVSWLGVLKELTMSFLWAPNLELQKLKLAENGTIYFLRCIHYQIVNVWYFLLESTFLHEFYELCVMIGCPKRAFGELYLVTQYGNTKIKTRGEWRVLFFRAIHYRDPLSDSGCTTFWVDRSPRDFIFVFSDWMQEKAHQTLSQDTQSGSTTRKTHGEMWILEGNV